jgi:surfeit locus 1 family protein
MAEPVARKFPIPIIPTIIVVLLAAAMVALGVWQLERRAEKEAAIALMQANEGKGATSFPQNGPVPTELMFRSSSVNCLTVAQWSVEAGKAADGTSGFRYIAHCTTGAEGQGALIAMGVGGKPDLKPAWTGGIVKGRIVEEPDHRSLLSRMMGKALVLRPMLVSDVAIAGLKAPAQPRVTDVPNNHLAYAVQWFIFATLSLVIYALALLRRARSA